MRIIKDPKEMYSVSRKIKNRSKTIALVPTMGALHEGHLSLVEAAKKTADVVVVSIFVNPIQFGEGEDFASYPRNIRKDQQLLKHFNVDILFLPDAGKMFGPDHATFIEVEGLSKKMCGRTRPTHFRGVATVVAKLFNIVDPDFAVFGEKDFQQQLIIKTLVRDLNFPVKIITRPTVREYDGLAMSSRNVYLSKQERTDITILYKILCQIKAEIENGERDLNKLLLRIRSTLGHIPHIRLDYAVLVDPETLEEVKKIKGQVLLALAAKVGKARLIDNILINA